ncbi:MAG TPA: OmpA family protein [Paracoccaceae bacterium]|nr:OmpA family protein [Paracoccaceae bacterium]
MFSIARAALACTALAALPHLALAQPLSAEEILKRLEAQSQAIESGPGQPRTIRPKTLAPIQPQDVPVQPPDDTVDLAVYFEFDSAILRPDAREQLEAACIAMKKLPRSYLIIGHTDAAGPDEYNRRLSTARAAEVVRYLVTDCGIEEARLQPIGLGETRLKDSADPLGAVNRRVEVQVGG